MCNRKGVTRHNMKYAIYIMLFFIFISNNWLRGKLARNKLPPIKVRFQKILVFFTDSFL